MPFCGFSFSVRHFWLGLVIVFHTEKILLEKQLTFFLKTPQFTATYVNRTTILNFHCFVRLYSLFSSIFLHPKFLTTWQHHANNQHHHKKKQRHENKKKISRSNSCLSLANNINKPKSTTTRSSPHHQPTNQSTNSQKNSMFTKTTRTPVGTTHWVRIYVFSSLKRNYIFLKEKKNSEAYLYLFET